jgi:glucosamine-6-phosphate deaminase
MNINISTDANGLGTSAARMAAFFLRKAVRENDEARTVLSTGSSQFETLTALLKEDIPWSKIEIFHLDEYIGLDITHKASFRKYLYERFINHISCRKFHEVDTGKDPGDLIRDLTIEINRKPLDVGLIGIGENGHIAFNDPPADFDTRDSYIIVQLDERCRMQQVGEGWFERFEEVPEKAVSMSVWQIMQCKIIVSAVPHQVKADAVYNTLTGKLSNLVPATMLKQHHDFNLFLDKNSASKIIPL